MNPTISFSNGITVHSNAFSSSSLIQGGDVFNINVNISHFSQEQFTSNSQACQQLPKVLNIKGIILLPLFLHLISYEKYSKIESNISNCAASPKLNVSLDNSTEKVILNIDGFNASWSSNFSLSFQVTKLIPADSLMSVNGIFSSSLENKITILAQYRSHAPKTLQVAVVETSDPQTPLHQIIDQEIVQINASFIVPSVSTSLTFIVTLPYFSGNIYMECINSLTKVTNISSGITTEKLTAGSYSELAKNGNNYIAKFHFSNTTSSTPATHSSGATIMFNIAAYLTANQPYVPNTSGNVSFLLEYGTTSGLKKLGPVIQTFNLSQPLLQVELKDSRPLKDRRPFCQGYDLVALEYVITNPYFATESVDKPQLISSDFPKEVKDNVTAKLCNAGNSCTDFGRVSVFNNTLHPGSSIHLNYLVQIQPSAVVDTIMNISLTLQYQRLSWDTPLNKTSKQSLPKIKSANVTGGANIYNSSVSSPNDHAVVTPGEDVMFVLTLTLPVATMKDFAMVVKSDGAQLVKGVVSQVGSGVSIGAGQLQGLALNTTSSNVANLPVNITSPVLYGVFPVLTNSDKAQLPGNGQVSFLITARAMNISSLTGRNYVVIDTEAFNDGRHMHMSTIRLKIIKPDLQISSTVNPTKQVNSDQDVLYTVTLSHSPISTSHAYRVVLEVAVPIDYLTLDVSSIQPSGGVSVVSGDKAPSGSQRYNDTSTKVVVFKADELNLNNEVTLRFKAKTKSKLPTSLFVKLPIHLQYTILLQSHAPRTGKVFVKILDSAPFLSFRPEPYVQVYYTSTPREVDAGDAVQFNATAVNMNTKHSAYDLHMTFTFKSLAMKNLTLNCSRGIKTFNNISTIATLKVAKLLPKERFHCDIKGHVVASVAPKQDVSPGINSTYFSTQAPRPSGSLGYDMTSHASTLVADIVGNVTASNNAEKLLAGQEMSFTLKLRIPECKTKLAMLLRLPVVSLEGTRFERQRRSLLGSNQRSRRSVSNLVHVLQPLVNQSTITSDSALNITHPSPNIKLINGTFLDINFGYVQNLPTPLRSYRVITVLLKFRSAPLPLILSGRSFLVFGDVIYTGGHLNVIRAFNIVGPLLKPGLDIIKSVKMFDQERDSPVFQYNVTVTHKRGSPCDAHDIIITDNTKNIVVDRLSVVPKSDVLVTYPTVNAYVLTYRIPILKVGQTVTMSYMACFVVKAKDEKTINLPSRMSWKSIQLNSPTYQKTSNLSACLERRDVSKYKTKQVTGYFALGILLGLLIGLIAACLVIALIIKCCDKGRIASCYLCFTNQESMTVLTGGSQYVVGKESDKKLIARHKEVSIVKTDESIVPILSLDDATQTEKELDSLDVQATVNLDVELESERQNMFLYALSLLVKKMRVKRDISESQEKKFVSKLKAELGAIGYKMSAEFKRKSVEITVKLQIETRKLLKEHAKREARERRETENKIKGLVDARERKEILEILRQRHAREEQELKRKAKLDLDVNMEKLRKEIAIGKRFATKECQSKLLQDLISESRLNEERASSLVRDHFAIMAAVDKSTDEERSRRQVALEMRLAERRALALQKLDDDSHDQVVMDTLAQHQDESLDDLIGSSKVSAADVNAYRMQYRKELEALSKKLQKERQGQEKKFHMKLTALKQQRAEDLAQKHVGEINQSNEEEDDKIEQVEIDCIAAVNERQNMIERQRRELEDLEKHADHEASDEIQQLHDRQSRALQEQAKTSIQRICKDMTSKGLDESHKNAIIDKYVSELSRQQEVKEQQRQRNTQLLEKRLSKLKKVLEKKSSEEMKEQEQVRKREEEIISELIVSQVVMSEEERDKIIEEHEKNLAELESSLTLNKLRQRQKLEERLAEKKKQKMEQLEKQQQQEEEIKDYGDKILNEAEDIELLKKHEQEKVELLKEDDENRVDELMEQVRQDMMNERTRKLQEHQENISATIAKLQIEKAKQVSQMMTQQGILNQLQTNLVDELESTGVFKDPEAIEIVEKYKKDAKRVEANLNKQRTKQEEDLKERLQQKLKERNKTILLENKAKSSGLTDEDSNVPVLVRFRKAAMKARQEKQMDEMKNKMEKEMEQSLNQLRVNNDLHQMKVTEERNIKFIAVLVQKGQLKMEELESTLKFLFPTKPPEYINSLLSKIYGTGQTTSVSGQKKGSLALNNTSEMGQLEKRVRRASMRRPMQNIQFLQSGKKRMRKKSKLAEPDENNEELPPVRVMRSSKRPPAKLLPLEDHPTGSPETNIRSPLLKPITRAESPASNEDHTLLDEMFGDSPEPDSPKAVKRRKKKRKENYRNLSDS